LQAPDLNPQQPVPEGHPVGAGFAGHSVNVGVGAANLPPPPPYSLHAPQRQVYPCAPPPYSPLASGPVSGTEIPESLEYCLFRLEQAYKTDFTELAETLSHFRGTWPLKSPFNSMAFQVLNPESQEKNSSKNFLQLARTVWTFFNDEYYILQDSGSYSSLSQLTVVTCMYLLEQKFNPQHQASMQKPSGDKASSAAALTDGEKLPALVRKTFFQNLLTAAGHSHRNDAKTAINKFVQNNRSGLQADMDSPHPVTGNLKFSTLHYEDIPGTTISKLYRPQLDAYSREYSIDLSGLVEVLGQTKTLRNLLPDPLEKVMQDLALETDNRHLLPKTFFHNKAEPFRDRNARCLLELINFCQNQVSRQHSNTSDHAMGEKGNDARLPLQQSSAGNQQGSQAVIGKLREWLITHSDRSRELQKRLNDFFQ
ncbi:hypothetical protein, partial [Endozoicomonas sp. ONNA2]|uniref:hypothetical protein n=1 Tax=Endozoicomonas sp. ONNA2 TaxID=2828741 RepID=UPI002147A781